MSIQITGQLLDKKNSGIFRLVERVLNGYSGRCPVLIGISGAGGAGKTTLAKNLCSFIGTEQAFTIDLDDYLISREERGRLEVTGYNPAANRISLAKSHVETLSKGGAVIKPRYDHRTGLVLPDERILPNKVIVAEGVTTLYPELRNSYTISFFLDAPEETQFKSRLLRDVTERGYTEEEAKKLLDAIRPDYARFIEPTKKFADVVCHVNTDYIMTITRLTDRFR